MERVEEYIQTIDVFENQIEEYMRRFCEDQKIDDMAKEPQSKWNACLLFIRKHVFNDKDMLKDKNPIDTYVNSCSGLNRSNCNRYDIDMVNDICDYYIYICLLNNKAVSIQGFCNMTGIDDTTVYAWKNGNNKLSTTGSAIWQKLNDFNEQFFEGLLADGKRNPLGAFGVLKHRHGWESPYTGDSNRQKQPLTAAELPKLVPSNCTEIADKSAPDHPEKIV